MWLSRVAQNALASRSLLTLIYTKTMSKSTNSFLEANTNLVCKITIGLIS